MAVKLGVVMDPIANINYKKDTTMAMLWAADARGWELFYMEQSDLYLEQGVGRTRMARLNVFRDPDQWFKLDDPEDADLADLDVILMRKDPPFDNEYIYSTYILEAAEREGTLIVNRCQSLRDCNEKVFATQFPQCCPLYWSAPICNASRASTNSMRTTYPSPSRGLEAAPFQG